MKSIKAHRVPFRRAPLSIRLLLVIGPAASMVVGQQNAPPEREERLKFRTELAPGEFLANLRADSVAKLAFFDWEAGSERASIKRVNSHFLRKMQGAMALLLTDDWFRERQTHEFFSLESLEYWGIRKGRGGCIATAVMDASKYSYMQVMYFPGSHLALRIRAPRIWSASIDPDAPEFRVQLLQHLIPWALRIPYRLPDAVDIDAKEQQVAGVKVVTGRLILGRRPLSGLGADDERLSRDALFESIWFTLVDSEPAYMGFVVYLPDPDKTKWCKQPIVVADD